MKKNLILLIVIMTIASCSQQRNYSIKINKEGDVIRLNERTGDVCVVGINCNITLSKLKEGKIYHYKGGDVFHRIPSASCQLETNPDGMSYSEWRNLQEKIEAEDLKIK